MPIVLNGVNADGLAVELVLVLFCWRLFGINWDVGEVYSGARGVDVGGKRVIGIWIGACCWEEYCVGIEVDVSPKWSDKWDVPPSDEITGRLLAYKKNQTNWSIKKNYVKDFYYHSVISYW